MRWSKLKRLVEDGFDESIRGRVTVNSAAYGNCSCGHAWLTIDKELIANFCTRAHWRRKYYHYKKGRYIVRELTDGERSRYRNQFVEYGDYSRQDFYRACWSFVHELTIQDALSSSNVLIQCLAVLDKRVGKRRLRILASERRHLLVSRLLNERLFAANHM